MVPQRSFLPKIPVHVRLYSDLWAVWGSLFLYQNREWCPPFCMPEEDNLRLEITMSFYHPDIIDWKWADILVCWGWLWQIFHEKKKEPHCSTSVDSIGIAHALWSLRRISILIGMKTSNICDFNCTSSRLAIFPITLHRLHHNTGPVGHLVPATVQGRTVACFDLLDHGSSSFDE